MKQTMKLPEDSVLMRKNKPKHEIKYIMKNCNVQGEKPHPSHESKAKELSNNQIITTHS